MGSFVKESDRKKVWSMSTVNAWATCSVGSFHEAQGECPPAAEGNRNLTGQGGGGNSVFYRKMGHQYIILPTVQVAVRSRSPGTHLSKSSGRVH